MCVANDWVTPEVDPSFVSTTRHQQLLALSGNNSFPPWHVDVGWQEERLAACGMEPCTPVRERKAVGRKPDQRRQKAELGKSTAPYIYEGQWNRHRHTLIGCPRSWPRVSPQESIKNPDQSLDIRPFRSFPRAQAYSFTRYDSPETNRLLR